MAKIATESVDYEKLKAKFLHIYDNLPLNERTKVIVFLEDEPLSWKIARSYVLYNPEKGEKILKELRSLDLI